MLTKENLRGVWAGVPTSWGADGRFDAEAFGENVRRLCSAGVHGVLTTSTSGEFYTLAEDEFRRHE